MACDVPPRECLAWHILPRLADAKLNDAGTSLRALCPAHDDRERSLGVSIGEKQRIIWQCFACVKVHGDDAAVRVRAALVGACRIDRGCLPLSKQGEAALIDRIEALLCSATKEDTLVRLQALAMIRGFRQLPRGAELLDLGADIGIGRSQAFDAARRLRASTASAARQGDSSTRRPARRVAGGAKSGNPDSVRKPGLTKTRKSGPKSGNPDSWPEAS
jgi:hypothetical protein